MSVGIGPLAEVISPDGDWKALEYETFYDGPFPFLTDIVAGVRLTSVHEPSRTADIVVVSTDGADDDPDNAWAAPRKLQVTLHSSLDVNLLTCEFGGVRIDIRFPPDDAPNRAAVYRQTGNPDPDPGAALTKKCP